MTLSHVTLIDYGVGNLFSVQRALELCGAKVIVTSDPQQIEQAERLVLPGVGAFADGMKGLIERSIDSAIVAYTQNGRPLLGICLGMQLLATVSEEFGHHNGLNIIPGRVLPVPATTSDGRSHKIPHIGWAGLQRPARLSNWNDTVLAGVNEEEEVYLVHSYAVVPDDEAYRLSNCDYDGQSICTAMRRGTVYGTQFHPEKSGQVGLRILQNFCALPVSS
jgi:glutamine amidotransferase